MDVPFFYFPTEKGSGSYPFPILFLGLSSPSPRKKRKTCKSVTPRKASLSGSAEMTSTLPKVRLTYGQATADGCSEREPKRSNVKDNDCSRSSAAATK